MGLSGFCSPLTSAQPHFRLLILCVRFKKPQEGQLAVYKSEEYHDQNKSEGNTSTGKYFGYC